MGRLTVIVTSPRVAPGLLSAQAWQALLDAEVVYALTPVHPQIPYLRDAQIPVVALDTVGEQGLTVQAVAAQLLKHARRGEVAFLADEQMQPVLAQELASLLAGQGQNASEAADAVELEVVCASWDLPGAKVLDVVAVMDRLRSPGGCSWDAQQTHQSLVTYLVEETYEVIEAIENGSREDLREELGDLLLQVFFHARLEEEDPQQPWSIDEVSQAIAQKLRRRHPHVFADPATSAQAQAHAQVMAQADPSTAEGLHQYESTWQQMKIEEKARDSVLDGVPQAQPALSLAAKMLSRVSRAGLQVQLPSLAPDHLNQPDPNHDQDLQSRQNHQIGVQMLQVVERARGLGVDPEAALRQVLRDYAATVRRTEQSAKAS